MLINIQVDWILLHISSRQKPRRETELTINSSCAGGNQNTAGQSQKVAQVTTLDIASRRRINTDWTLEKTGRSREGDEGVKGETRSITQTLSERGMGG